MKESHPIETTGGRPSDFTIEDEHWIELDEAVLGRNQRLAHTRVVMKAQAMPKPMD